MSREEMIRELTDNELGWLMNGVSDADYEHTVWFFSAGGFTTFTNEQLKHACKYLTD